MPGEAPGERDLRTLLRQMQPELDARAYVFASVQPGALDRGELPSGCLGIVREAEGVTLVLERAEAERMGLGSRERWAHITLAVHSSLSAVGFLARVTTALAAAGISVNPLAGYHHDHLLVLWDERDRALVTLRALAETADLR